VTVSVAALMAAAWLPFSTAEYLLKSSLPAKLWLAFTWPTIAPASPAAVRTRKRWPTPRQPCDLTRMSLPMTAV